MLPVLFSNRWNDLLPGVEELLTGQTGMPLDVRQGEGGWTIEAEVPGIARDGVEISVENGVLTVSAEYRRSSEEKSAHYHVRERRVGRVSRSVALPEAADADKIDARLENGVLTLTIPVREEAKPRRVEIK